uniref:Integrase catalytic domain-containing protein n=1 Tax=Latimeria chalumnae TaxID=7897 RepID=H3AWH4_LATCH
MTESCEFRNTKNEQIHDRLVSGILDKELSQKLQLEPELTLEKAIQTAHDSELVKGRAMKGRDEVSQKPSRFSETRKGWLQRSRPLQTQKAGPKCTRCGRGHTHTDNCTARNAECRKCKKIGHFAAVRRTKEDERTVPAAGRSGCLYSMDDILVYGNAEEEHDNWEKYPGNNCNFVKRISSMERVGADICEWDRQHYLIVIDYFYKHLETVHLPDMTSQTAINYLKNVFARWGCPDKLVTDNGLQFVGKAFKELEHQYNFNHITTSLHYPQANGEAERAVQTAKRILKQKDPFFALLSYRATPLNTTKSSPAQLIMGRQLRTPIPTLEKNSTPKWPDLKCVR